MTRGDTQKMHRHYSTPRTDTLPNGRVSKQGNGAQVQRVIAEDN